MRGWGHLWTWSHARALGLLRDQATKYWELAAQANDPVAKQELCELARVCKEVADDMDDRRVSG
jgi:hypothetical protein